jgi:uncharacterized protein DUF222/HNH endonuclease
MQKLADEIVTLASHINAATARWLRLLADFDDGVGWDGYRTCAEWLSWRCGITVGTARDQLRVAQALKTRPLLAAAFERGELSYSKVRALVRLDDDFDEHLMLAYAQNASASQIETIVRGCRRCVAVEEGSERQFAEREFSWGYDEDGAVLFRGRLPAELGALVIRAIEAARDQLGPPPRERPDGLHPVVAQQTHSPGARNADGLVALAQSALAEKATNADAYQVVVHVDAQTLTESAEVDPGNRCTLGDGAPLPSAVARRLACDSSVVRVLERDGQTISLGRKTRTISPALRRALHMRDKCCAFPGCYRKTHLHGHHVKHWADGGATDLDNVVHLCPFHHRLVHEGGYEVRRGRDAFTFWTPAGKPIPQAPRQPRGDCTALIGANAKRGLAPDALCLHPPDPNPRAHLAWSVDALMASGTRARGPADRGPEPTPSRI